MIVWVVYCRFYFNAETGYYFTKLIFKVEKIRCCRLSKWIFSIAAFLAAATTMHLSFFMRLSDSESLVHLVRRISISENAMVNFECRLRDSH